MGCRTAPRVAVAVFVLLGAAACASDDGEAPAAVADAAPIGPATSQLDVPPTGPPPTVLASAEPAVDPATVPVCEVLSIEGIASIVGADDPAVIASDEKVAAVEPFGDIRTCAWSVAGSPRALNLGVTAPGPGLGELLGLSLVADATLGFDRRDVEVGDRATAQVADSSSQGVSRLCIATSARGVLWLACLEAADHSFSLDDPELAELTDILQSGLARL